MAKINKNPVKKRIAVKAECLFDSPALIGSGYGENTDSDILRDSEGRPFLPGSTIAGVLRSLCSDAQPIFGGQDGISPLWIFDSDLRDDKGKNKADIIELDGVAIGRENKTALDQKKYDYEAVSVGSKFTLRLLLTIRANDNISSFEEMLASVLGAIKSDQAAFGAKTNRGFGRINCIKVTKLEFDLSPGNTDILNKWLNFDWNSATGWEEAKSHEYSSKTAVITANLTLDGSIMIRDTHNIYEGLADGDKVPDYKHISVGGNPVILGTSWAGAFSSGLHNLLKPRFEDKIGRYFKNVFGYDQIDSQESDINVSKIMFDMSVLEINNPKEDGYRHITRVKIDRFTGGAADGALFNEMPWYGGKTTLKVRYPKDREDIKELILLGFECLDAGLLQAGGETGIGRGFFKVTEINGEPCSNFFGQPKDKLSQAIEKVGEKHEDRL